jgi:tRNA(His) guanylyltransferase
MKDALGDRMKKYEKAASPRLLPLIPICARLDGKCFSKWTKGLFRPFDASFSRIMQQVTLYLVKETNACIGYTQSDEISLIYYSANHKSQVFFEGKLQKMISVLASMCTMEFNALKNRCAGYISNKPDALFDCRVWTVPTLVEATNVLLWREWDATKNSISMAAHHHFSHKELQGKNCGEMQDMLMGVGVNWNHYPVAFKRGTYFQRKTVLKSYSNEELEKLPAKHEAHSNPNLMVERSQVERVDMPIFGHVVNKCGVVFNGATPKVEENKGN